VKKFLLSLALLVFSLTISVFASPLDFLIQDGVLTRYLGSDSMVYIPDSVVEIANDSLAECDFVLELVVGPNVLKIGDTALSGVSDQAVLHVVDGSYAKQFAIDSNVPYRSYSDLEALPAPSAATEPVTEPVTEPESTPAPETIPDEPESTEEETGPGLFRSFLSFFTDMEIGQWITVGIAGVTLIALVLLILTIISALTSGSSKPKAPKPAKKK
jgi:hypothetical protein